MNELELYLKKKDAVHKVNASGSQTVVPLIPPSNLLEMKFLGLHLRHRIRNSESESQKPVF